MFGNSQDMFSQMNQLQGQLMGQISNPQYQPNANYSQYSQPNPNQQQFQNVFQNSEEYQKYLEYKKQQQQQQQQPCPNQMGLGGLNGFEGQQPPPYYDQQQNQTSSSQQQFQAGFQSPEEYKRYLEYKKQQEQQQKPPPGYDHRRDDYYHKQGNNKPQPKGFLTHVNGNFGVHQGLDSGDYILSQGKKYYLVLHDNGNLNIYSDPSYDKKYLVWSSKSAGRGSGPYNAKLQTNGNFVIKDRNQKDIWQTQTANQDKPPYNMDLTDKGELVLSGMVNKSIWSSKRCY